MKELDRFRAAVSTAARTIANGRERPLAIEKETRNAVLLWHRVAVAVEDFLDGNLPVDRLIPIDETLREYSRNYLQTLPSAAFEASWLLKSHEEFLDNELRTALIAVRSSAEALASAIRPLVEAADRQ